MLKSHEELIHGNILPRLDVMEKEHKAFREEVTTMKSDLMGVQRGQAQLEVTVMKDGQETRALLKQFVDHYFKQDSDEAQAEKDLKIKRLEARQNIMTAIFGAGGLAGVVSAIVALMK